MRALSQALAAFLFLTGTAAAQVLPNQQFGAPVHSKPWPTPQQPQASGPVQVESGYDEHKLVVNPDGSINAKLLPASPAVTTARSGCAVVNTTATLTISPPAGMFVYITHLYLAEWQDGTGGAETTKAWTLTNLASITLDYTFSAAAAANSYLVIADEVGAPLFKSTQPGVAVAITSPAAATDNGLCTLVSYYFGQ